MTNFRFLLITLALFIAFSLNSANAAEIAVVDFADQWTQVDALRQTLDKFGVEYDDLTKEIETGKLSFKPDNKFFFIGSMTTNNATLHQNLDKNEAAIQEFVRNGGIVLEPTQADQNEANVDWLPDELTCVRSDPDKPNVEILKPDHPLFNAPNKMTVKEFTGWGHQGWPTVWEVIALQKGFTVLMETDGNPVIMEAEYGEGKFVMMCLAPDKYTIAGNDGNTKDMAGRFMENILETYLLSLPVEPAGKFTTTWGQVKSR
jgi:hypothetical protein